ncbi:preprotein translocase subunit YajC [Companilactobacillus hulinensis]|uniref:preprotein translocase subunit YajC n=1 Tax=Companilactobacillus hulinensis TaxID=2486007 RepID=UPI000F7BAB3B|nr:preprotein translocase subunit YajC [Companilactobacillus hulinensis]
MHLIDYLLIAALVVLIVIYAVLIPISRNKQMKQQKSKMDEFYASLSTGDEVLLRDGITGFIQKINDDKIKLKIASNVVIDVNKYGIISKIEEEKNE